ncbi:MAG: hypothetical protein AAF329_06045 [Cyanobacteria bacterium P01_A01_bin.17]
MLQTNRMKMKEEIVCNTDTELHDAVEESTLGHQFTMFNKAFEEITDRKSPSSSPMFTFILQKLSQYNLLPRYDEAAILQEVYLRGVEKINKGRTIANHSAWIRAVAFRYIRELSRENRHSHSPIRSAEYPLNDSCDVRHRKTEFELVLLDSLFRALRHIKETISTLLSDVSGIDEAGKKRRLIDCNRFLVLMNNFLVSVILMTLPRVYRDEAIFCFWNSEEQKTIMLAFSYLLGGLDYRCRKTMMSFKLPVMR